MDDEGGRMTAFQSNPIPFGGLVLPLMKRTFNFDAGPLGKSYQHVLLVKPENRASGADIMVNVTLEARH